MSTVDENGAEGHGLVGETVDEGSLEFTLNVMSENERDEELLVEEERLLGSLDVETES